MYLLKFKFLSIFIFMNQGGNNALNINDFVGNNLNNNINNINNNNNNNNNNAPQNNQNANNQNNNN